MRSDRPKVLHQAAGRPLLDRVLDTAPRLAGGAGGRRRRRRRTGERSARTWRRVHPASAIAVQEPPRGTGDAVRAAAAAGAFGNATTVVVLSGDVPLLSPSDGEAPRRRAERGREGGGGAS